MARRAIQNGKKHTHTFVSNGTVYMIIWFPFSCFGRYVYLDFFYDNNIFFSFAFKATHYLR